MKRLKSLTNRSGLFGVILAFFATTIGVTSCRPDFDLDKRMPEWLGTSIYETLNEGFKNDSTDEEYSFKTFVRLIEDMDQVKILAKTGSKTIFVADDKAFERFFQNCPFFDDNGNRITSYDQLTKAQKSMILNGSMLNNVYQVAMLSSSPGGDDNPPVLGSCMRRVSAAQVLDTIPVVKPQDFPKNNKYWDRLRNKGKSIVLLQDGTNKPIIFFVNKFLQNNRIDNDDYDFLFRLGKYSKIDKPAHVPGDASVNGVAIAWPNKKCFNGFIHVMEEVIYLLPNMADYIATDPNSQIYSSILDRFSVPQYSSRDREDRDENVRMLLNAGLVKSPALEQAMRDNGDSVFVKKYLSERARLASQNPRIEEYIKTNMDNMKDADNAELLKFDPAWNSYISSTSGNNNDVALQQDMGLMFVPEDEALMTWWLDETQLGSRLRAAFGLKKDMPAASMTKQDVIDDMAGVPLDVIAELVNNNMQYSLVGSVPSKFGSVLNDAMDPFFDKKSREESENTISNVVMCCNGAVFFTNSIYAPTSYKSVAYPVLVNDKLKIIDWAIRSDKQLAYKAYLNSMVATYSFFVPLIDTVAGSTFENKLVWIDPASFYLDKEGSTYKALAFSYQEAGNSNKVLVDVYDFDKTNGTFTPTGIHLEPGTSDDDTNLKFIRNRILDLMDYHIVIGDVEAPGLTDAQGYSFYRTKGRGTIRFKNSATVGDIDNMDVQGGWQIENTDSADWLQRPVKIVQRVDLSKTSLSQGNGRTYIIDRPLLPSRKSVYDIVSDTVNYPEFKSFYKIMLNSGIFASTSNSNQIGSLRCISTFNTYHYTVYIPKNAGIDALLANKTLMMPDELSDIEAYYDLTEQYIKDDYVGDPEEKDDVCRQQFRDSLIVLSVQLFGVPDTAGADIAVAPRKSGESDAAYARRSGPRYFTNKKLDQLKNFVKYHIQDNSVYIGADFNAGVDELTGNPAEKAQYETAFMNDKQQFVKVTVKGGEDITIYDAKDENGNSRHVRNVLKETSPTGKPYYNIMCREYEIKPTTGSTLSESSYNAFSIETSSYAVVHLIDEPLCNGDLIF